MFVTILIKKSYVEMFYLNTPKKKKKDNGYAKA